MAHRETWLPVTILILAMVIVPASVAYRSLPYPFNRCPASSLGLSGYTNVIVRGIVSDLQQNHKSEWYTGCYYFRLFISVNVTQILWVRDNTINSTLGWHLAHWNRVGVGYDIPGELHLSVGQEIEVSGFWRGAILDVPFANTLVVAPSIQGSYVMPRAL